MRVLIHTLEPLFVDEVRSALVGDIRWIATEQWLHRIVVASGVDAIVLDARLDAAPARCARLCSLCAAPIVVVAATDRLDEHVRLLRGGATTVLRRPLAAADLQSQIMRRGVGRAVLAANWDPRRAQLSYHDAQLLAILRERWGQVVPGRALRAAIPAQGSLASSIAHLRQALLLLDSMAQIESLGGGYRLTRRTLN